jgi:hypothetical protein
MDHEMENCLHPLQDKEDTEERILAVNMISMEM